MMTQAVRQKWMLVVVSANALLALVVMAVLGYGLSRLRDRARQASVSHDVELITLRGEVERLRSAVQELRPPPANAELAQTLQTIASEQQLLLLRALQQGSAAVPAAATAASDASPARAGQATSPPESGGGATLSASVKSKSSSKSQGRRSSRGRSSRRSRRLAAGCPAR